MKNFIASIIVAAMAACLPTHSSAADNATTQVAVAPAVHCPALPAPGGVQKRIVEKAAQGVDALRDFIYITRGIYALDMFEVVGWLDARRSCGAVAVAVATDATTTR